MNRNRFARFPNRGRNRNLQNLHVIPTASAMNLKQAKSSVIGITASEVSNNSTGSKKFFIQNNQIGMYKKKYNRGRNRNKRKKKGKSFPDRTFSDNVKYGWYNSNCVDTVETCPKKETEKMEESASEVPGKVSDVSGKSVPDVSGENVPVVSGKNVPGVSGKNVPGVSGKNISDTVEENCFEEVEVASVDGETKHEILVRFRRTKLSYLKYKRSGFFKPKFYHVSDPTFVNCLNVHDDVDVDIVSEAEYEYETDNLEQSDSQDILNKTVEVDNSEKDGNKLQRNKTPEDASTSSEPIKRMYKVCVKENNDFSQGKSLIQVNLDSWDSHLIGLEYLIEIRGVGKDSIPKYYCVLCSEELKFLGFSAVCVINHINSCMHVVRYLEKHFPSCGYKFTESSDFNVVSLKKIAEEINKNLGYYYMCISNIDYYVKNDQNIKELIHNAYHPNEKDLKLKKELFVEKIDSGLEEEIKSIVNDILEKVCLISEVDIVNKNLPENKESEKISVPMSDSKVVKDSGDKTPAKNDLIVIERKKPVFKVNKGASSLSTYLQLKHFSSSAFKKPAKRRSNISKEVSVKNENLKKKEVTIVKDKKVNPEIKKIAKHKVLKDVNSDDVKNVHDETEANIEVIEENDDEVEENMDDEVEVEENADAEIEENDVDFEENVDAEVDENVDAEVEENADVEENVDAEVEENLDGEVMENIDDEGDAAMSNVNKKGYKFKESVPLKTSTVHSKHCRKRILSKESARSKLVVKASSKATFVTGVSQKSSVKIKSSKESAALDASNKKTEKDKEKLKLLRDTKSSSQKRTSLHKVIAIQKAPVKSKSSVTKHSSSHTVTDKKSKDSSSDKHSVTKNEPSVWKPIAQASRSPVRKQSRSPRRRNSRKHSKSPTKRIKSPLRHVKRLSRSPVRRKSRSPFRPRVRSPLRRRSRSPLRNRSRSPVRRRSRSPLRRQSRSPLKLHSRSPRRRSRSPLGLHLRSPIRRHSRSPLRRRSRSPLRRRSRSPLRRRSRSPLRRRSRSPLSGFSRSPVRRYSRSPIRRQSRSPLNQHSRSPFRHLSRDLLRRQSRSPGKRRSESSDRMHSTKIHSLNIGHSDGIKERLYSEGETSRGAYNYDKRLIKELSKVLRLTKRNMSEKYRPQLSPHTSARGISDLDPVSDEDESLYFNDKHQSMEDTNVSPSSKVVLAKLLQKFSMADVNPNDPALNKLMQFMEAHSAEIQDLMGAHPKPGSSINVSKMDSNLQERSLFLQQYLLSNLAGNNQQPRMLSPAQNMPPIAQPPFIPIHPGFAHATNIPNIPPPNVSQPIQQRFFPPNVNVPPPQLYHQINQPRQDFPPKPNVPPEVVFKDLKATVNKLFGANESVRKQEKAQMPGYVTQPDPDKWDLSHPDTLKFNAPVGSKNMFHPQGKNIEFSPIPQNPVRGEIPMYGSNKPPGQYFGNSAITRPQIPKVPIPPPDAKVSFCDVSHSSSKGNLFPVVPHRMDQSFNASSSRGGGGGGGGSGGVSDVKVSLAQRLASVLVKVGMIDVPAPLLQEMLMKIGAFSSSPRQDISEAEIISILKRLGYLS